MDDSLSMLSVEPVLILLSTYNGSNYLNEQIDSLYGQTYNNIKIIARDDGSNDITLEVLKSYNIELMPQGEHLGPKSSFSALSEYALKKDYQYFMFCDQDDVWEKDKVEKSLEKIKKLEKEFPNKPLLVHTDLEIVNEKLVNIHESMWHYEHLNPKLNSFNQLLMQNTITGCSIMVNKKLLDLAMPIPKQGVIMHDWWIGLVASKFGKITFIDKATIKYRQHKKNTIGAHGISFQYITKNINNDSILFKYSQQAQAFLERYRDELDTTTIEMLEEFTNIESKSFWQKRKILLKYKLLKQGFTRNLGLLLKI